MHFLTFGCLPIKVLGIVAFLTLLGNFWALFISQHRPLVLTFFPFSNPGGKAIKL